MTIFDYIVLIVVAFSVLISVLRGGVREVLSILGWLAAFYVAKTYVGALIPLMPEEIPTDELKTLAAFVILFLLALLVAGLVATGLATLLSKAGLGWFNRIMGALFGLARGLLVIGVGAMLAGMTSIPKDDVWTTAMLSAPVEAMVKAALPLLPETLSKRVTFD